MYKAELNYTVKIYGGLEKVTSEFQGTLKECRRWMKKETYLLPSTAEAVAQQITEA